MSAVEQLDDGESETAWLRIQKEIDAALARAVLWIWKNEQWSLLRCANVRAL
jgi:hypothetical protein